MKKSRIRVFMLYLSLLAHLFAGAGSVECVVLCFEADGQVAVECSNNGICCSALAVQTFSRSSSLSQDSIDSDHCGICWDFPLLFSGIRQPFIFARNSLPNIEPVFALINLSPTYTLSKIASEGNILQPTSTPNSASTFNQNVILLI